jgi:hypothetical protein
MGGAESPVDGAITEVVICTSEHNTCIVQTRIIDLPDPLTDHGIS